MSAVIKVKINSHLFFSYDSIFNKLYAYEEPKE